MLCVKALFYFALIVHLEGHQLEERQASMSAEDIVRDLYRWKMESDEKLVALQALIRTSQLPPLGFTYVQYGQQEEPQRLWPGATWTNVSPKYTGAFFRAEGGRSGSFGQYQEESMRTIGFDFLDYNTGYIGMTLLNGHDAKINVGGNGGKTVGLHVSYKQNDKPYLQRSSSNEVRPYNQAIRIWKRTA